MSALSRRTFLQRGGAALALPWLLDIAAPPSALAAEAAGATSGWGDAQYWAFADRIQGELDRHWSPEDRMYDLSGSAGETSINANMLYVHSAAALSRHRGACRHDERAAAIARRLCESPPYLIGSKSRLIFARKALGDLMQGQDPTEELIAHADADQTHPWGWGASMAARRSARGHRRRRRSRGSRWRTARATCSTCPSPPWSPSAPRPPLRLQHVLRVPGPAAQPDQLADRDLHKPPPRSSATTHLLAHDTRLQLSRFADRRDQTPVRRGGSHPGAGYRFHYLPQASENHKYNLDSAEYANIVCGVPRRLQAGARRRDAGARPGPRAASMRAWVERVAGGYWTHAGYLNWDTGLGFKRWHQGKKLGLSQAALLGHRGLRRSSRRGHAAWAKHMLDRSFELFDRWMERDRGGPPPTRSRCPRSTTTRARRCSPPRGSQANAAQAALYGLGQMSSERAAAAVRLRPGRRPARGHHARLQHGDRRGQHAARSRTAGSRSRGSSTASRTSPAASAGAARVVRRLGDRPSQRPCRTESQRARRPPASRTRRCA